MIKWLYKRYKRRFEDLMVEDYLQTIPEDVKKGFFQFSSNNKKVLDKATSYMAYNLHRQMVRDVKNSERYQGMFIQLKLFSAIFTVRENAIDNNKTPKNKVFDYKTQIKNFVDGFKSN